MIRWAKKHDKALNKFFAAKDKRDQVWRNVVQPLDRNLLDLAERARKILNLDLAVPKPDVPKRVTGFATLSPEEREEISRRGGIASQASGNGHQFTTEEAEVAGHKGGSAPHVQWGKVKGAPKKEVPDKKNQWTPKVLKELQEARKNGAYDWL